MCIRDMLADHAKVSRTSIRCWETGQKTISQKCFRLLAENLGPDFLSGLPAADACPADLCMVGKLLTVPSI